jgi:RNA polymerase sigma-70 factor (ECF subfamily)
MPALYRVPLVLVYMDGFLAREVADMLDVPLGTVLARLHRGRKLFERQMWDHAEQAGLLVDGRHDELR